MDACFQNGLNSLLHFSKVRESCGRVDMRASHRCCRRVLCTSCCTDLWPTILCEPHTLRANNHITFKVTSFHTLMRGVNFSRPSLRVWTLVELLSCDWLMVLWFFICFLPLSLTASSNWVNLKTRAEHWVTLEQGSGCDTRDLLWIRVFGWSSLWDHITK